MVSSPPRTLYASTGARMARSQPVTLVDLLDRLLAGGVVVHGQITLAVADIDLVDVDVALLVAATAKVASR
jgi:Gas vesicle protein